MIVPSLLCCLLHPDPVTPLAPSPADWPQWRGPLACGWAPDANPPTEWSEERNVRWKVGAAGRGHSTPVAFGDRLFLTGAEPFGDTLEPRPDSAPGAHDNAPVTHRQRYVVTALSLGDGRRLWRREVREELPREGGHVTASFASPSPVCDAERVIASFGSGGLYAFDHDGNPLWENDLGDMASKHGHGEGSSPFLWRDVLVVQWDHEGGSFLAALSAETGEELWRTSRSADTSWSTPLVLEVEGRAQVVVSGSEVARGYDLASGAELWSCEGLSHNVVASPVAEGTRVFLGSSYEKQSLLALELAGARGDLTRSKEHLLWLRRRSTPYVPSPLVVEGSLYFLHHYQATLSRVSTADGRETLRGMRLDLGDVYSSPIAAGGRIYVTDREGRTVVLSVADEPQVLARNRLDDSFSASAVAVGRKLVLRGETFLYCLEQEE